MMRILSLGAGVQSSTLALMIAKGLVPMVECAIFADTQWEPRAVMDWLTWLEQQLPFPVHRVTNGNLREAAQRIGKPQSSGKYFTSVPWFMHNGGGMGSRQCTRDYKVIPIRRKARALLGPKGKVEMLIGISLDEAYRMKPSPRQWQVHTWPLIDLRMTRADCLIWMERNGYPQPPKSSCLGCPYHSDPQWQAIKDGPAEEWADVIAVDAMIRTVNPTINAQQFMHRTCKPIDQVQFSNETQIDMFMNECEGLCGV